MNRKQLKDLCADARYIHENLLNERQGVVFPVVHRELVDSIESNQRSMRKALKRRWFNAADALMRQQLRLIENLSADVDALKIAVSSRLQPTFSANPADIFDDLIELRREFAECRLDRSRNTLTVQTEAIELEGVYLGPFEIVLDFGANSSTAGVSYEVVAVDPNPAASNEDVTHPHVQGGGVCEGEAIVPIRSALKQGRILDFFQIVTNLLQTYNSDSPYVSLDDWHGIRCGDCDYVMNSDESWTCQACSGICCSECKTLCGTCDDSQCNECIETCEGCSEAVCSSCAQYSEQGDLLCPECFREKERSNECEENEEGKPEEIGEEGSGGTRKATVAGIAANSVATVQPDGVGETVVPA